MDAAQATYFVFLFKLVICGGLIGVWFVWFCWKLLGFIDSNVALTEPEPSWREWFQYQLDLRLHPEKDWEPVPRPRIRIGFLGFTVLTILVLLIAASC
jgi:hypothetical protein